MIGKGFFGLAPWDDFQRVVDKEPTKEEMFDYGSPMRIADVIQQPKTVIIEVESV